MNPLYVLVVLTLLAQTVQVGARLAVMLYAVHLAASPAIVGIIAALFTLLSMFTSVHVGRWIDRSGARIPMLVGTVMLTAGAAIGVVWRELAALFAISVVIGTFHNLIFISQQRLAGQYGRPEDRVRNFSLTSLSQSAGGMVGPIIAGFTIDSLGYPGTFLVFTLIAALPLTALAFNLLEYPPKEAAPTRKAGERVGTMRLFRDADLRRIYTVSVLTSSTWSIVIFLLPLYGTQIGLGATTIGFIIGAFSVATVVIRVVLPWLSRHLTPWQLMIASLITTAAAFVPIPIATSVPLLTLFAACIGMGLGLCGPLSQALLYDASPPGRIGELLGLRVTMLNGSHTAVPLLTGAIGTAIGVGPVFWVIGGCLFTGSWLIRAQWRRTSRRSAGHP